MHSRRAVLACLLGTLTAEAAAAAELLPEPATHHVKSEALRLIQQDFLARKETERSQPPARAAGEVLDLPKMTVKDKEPPKLPSKPPHEPKLQEFFRTGTIWESHPGGIKLWVKGDKGIMLTLPF